MAVRLLLADDQPLIRAALIMATADMPDIEVIGEAGTGLEAVRMTRGPASPTWSSWTSACRAWTASRRHA